MKYIKKFIESKIFESNEIKQQPFFLVNDYLYVSNETARQLVRTPDEIRQYHKNNYDYFIDEIENFFNDTKNEALPSGYRGYKVNRLSTKYQVGWGHGYAMNIILSRGNIRNNEFGHFQYIIKGSSGDSDMHGPNMKRATRECNLNLMIKLYPIVKHIKNFYKRLNHEGFFDIIKDSIIKDNSLISYGAPDELLNDDEVGHLISANKYNL